MACLKRVALPALFLVGAAAALLVHAHDRAARRAPRAFAERYGFPARHASWVETAELAPSADIGANALAAASLGDALERRRWNDLTPDERQAWLAAIAHLDDQLADTRDLLLTAVRQRPGWAYHRMLLGQVVYAAGRRRFDPRVASRSEEWIRPLRLAQAAAPGEEAIAPFLAGACLESWQQLPAEARAPVPGDLARAFTDERFVARALPAARAALGDDSVLRMLPPRPASLVVARDTLLKAGVADAAARVDARWVAAERRARMTDLAAVRMAAQRRDRAALKARCRAFASAHPPRALDGPAERRAQAEVLELWPVDESGSFRSDARGALVRFFADGRLDEVAPEAVANAVDALGDAPDPYRALARLLDGDAPGFRSLLVSADARGALSFTPVFLAWCRGALGKGDLDEAREALGYVSPRARGECDTLLAERDVAKAAGDAAALGRAEEALAARRRQPLGASAASVASIPVCVDPVADAGARLAVTVRTQVPALVTWGFRGARQGARLLPAGENAFEVPLDGERGLTAVTLQPLGGARLELVGASRSARPAATPAPATAQSVAAVAGMERLKSTTP